MTPDKVKREIMQAVFMTPEEKRIATELARRDGRSVAQQIRYMLWQEALRRGIAKDEAMTDDRDEQDEVS